MIYGIYRETIYQQNKQQKQRLILIIISDQTMNSPSSILESINQLKNRMKNGKMELQSMKQGFSTNSLSKNKLNKQGQSFRKLHITKQQMRDNDSTNYDENMLEKQNQFKRMPLKQLNQYKSNNAQNKCSKNKIFELKKMHQKAILQIEQKHSKQIQRMRKIFEQQKEQISNQLQAKIEDQANYIMLLQQQLSPIQTQREQNRKTDRAIISRDLESVQNSQQKYSHIVSRLLQQNTVLLEQIQALKNVINQRDRLRQRKSLLDKNRMKFSKMSRSNSINSIAVTHSNHSQSLRQSERQSKQSKGSKQFRLTYSIDIANNTNFIKPLRFGNKINPNNQQEFYLFTKNSPDESEWIGANPPNENIDSSNRGLNIQIQQQERGQIKRNYSYIFQRQSQVSQWIDDDSIEDEDVRLRTIRNFIADKNMPPKPR